MFSLKYLTAQLWGLNYEDSQHTKVPQLRLAHWWVQLQKYQYFLCTINQHFALHFILKPIKQYVVFFQTAPFGSTICWLWVCLTCCHGNLTNTWADYIVPTYNLNSIPSSMYINHYYFTNLTFFALFALVSYSSKQCSNDLISNNML